MVLGSTVGGQQATLAQDAPRVAAMEADTGAVHAIGDLPGGGMAVGADKVLFRRAWQAASSRSPHARR